MKVVINRCFGGFSVSQAAVVELLPLMFDLRLNLRGLMQDEGLDESEAMHSLQYNFDAKRTDPLLIEVVERLGDAANGSCAKLKIVEIPDDVMWSISDYDGLESIEEEHRSWC